MQTAELEQRMQELGLPLEAHPVLTLLPMVEVAWADPPMNEVEVAHILRRARDLSVPEELAQTWLQRWLAERPPQHLFDYGREVLCQLVARHHGLDVTYTPETLPLLEQYCYEVAKVSGFGAISEAERATMRRINVSMERLLDELDYNPSRPGLGWGTLAAQFMTRPEDAAS